MVILLKDCIYCTKLLSAHVRTLLIYSVYADLFYTCSFTGTETEISHDHVGLDKIFERKIVNIFLPISLNVSFGCSKSFEYLQSMF